ncbi:MAG TPA: phage terminase small subunit P27 family [Verrucomicrobiae bacterium]|nr:phage terminase small subunit P27 family [Verrucomicrobiae bacterium]
MSDPGRPKCPIALDPVAQDAWDLIVPELERIGLLTVLDLGTLAAFCVAYGQMGMTAEILEREGRLVTLPDGTPAVHPAQEIQFQAMDQILVLGKALGLSPAARARLGFGPLDEAPNPDRRGLRAVPPPEGEKK